MNRITGKFRKLWIAAFCSALCVLALGVSLPAHETGFPEHTLKNVFPKATGFTLRKKTLSPDQIAKVEQASESKVQHNDNPLSFYVALGKSADGAGVLGTVVMVDTRGPKGALDLAVGIRRDGTVARIVVVANQDEPGLSADKFLAQIEGKNAQSLATLANDLQYSGNAQSAQALVNAVRRAVHLLAAATAS
jgi:Na+-translocating ferredoxin:NAD+ oxidoreductase RnfG subunit